jgi:hypothetical protein
MSDLLGPIAEAYEELLHTPEPKPSINYDVYFAGKMERIKEFNFRTFGVPAGYLGYDCANIHVTPYRSYPRHGLSRGELLTYAEHEELITRTLNRDSNGR